MRRSPEVVNVDESNKVPKMGWIGHVYLWLCERLYLELAWAYDWVSWLVSGGRWKRWQSGVWQEVCGHDVLELGPGNGELLVQGMQRGFSMVGIDRSPAMLAIAMQRARNMGVQVRCTHGDGRGLPFAESVFDTAFAVFPAGYIFEPTTLAEIQRVLRPAGRVVLWGLWVDLQPDWVGHALPVFYGRPDESALVSMVKRLAAAGFDAHWVETNDGRFTVGSLVAKRG